MPDRILIPILALPFQHFRAAAAYWFIHEDCRKRHHVTGNKEDEGLPCDEYLAGNVYCGHYNEEKGKFIQHTLSLDGRRQKARVEKYNKFRLDLYHLCKKQDFVLPAVGMSIYYHFPIPAYRPNKYRVEMHGKIKQSKPDTDNLNKALSDSLTGKDELIGQRSGDGKFWFDPAKVEPELQKGYIEFLLNQPVYNPYNVDLKLENPSVEMEDILVRREKAKARKAELREEKLQSAQKKERKPKPLKISEKYLLKKDKELK